MNPIHRSSFSAFSIQNVLIVCLLGTGNYAHAQSEDVSASVLEEIVVTARFREEIVQDIGTSIAAIGGDAIEREGLRDFEDIARRTVSLDILDRGPNQNQVSIRGVSSGVSTNIADFGTAGPLVSQFLDNIPVAATSPNQRDFNFFDFERVEVLRGPQPTLFGEGSVGGTIRYLSKNPDLSKPGVSDSVIKAGVSFTEDGGTNYAISAASSLNLIEDKLSIRGVINYRDDDGFIDNPVLGLEDMNEFESLSGRVVALYEPNEQLTVRFSAFLGADDILANTQVDATSSPDDLTNSISGFTNDEDNFELYSGEIQYDFGKISVTSITGYYERERSAGGQEPTLTTGLTGIYNNPLLGPVFPTFTPVVAVTSLNSKDESITQELRIISDFDGPLNYIAGFYYQETDYDSSVANTTDALTPFYVDPSVAGTLNTVVTSTDSRQISGFVELTYEVTEQMRLIGGVRYVDEKISVLSVTNDNFFGTGPFFVQPPLSVIDFNAFITGAGLPLENEFKLDRFLPRGAIEYDVNNDAMVYALVSTGVRNGNLNLAQAAFQRSGGNLAVFADAIRFDEDDVISYEIGAKTRWLDNSLTFNIAAYYTDYSDPQVIVASPFILTDNGPDQRVIGVEVESAYKINDVISIYANGAYQDAEFTEDALLNQNLAGTLGILFDVLDGNKANNVPEFTFSAGADVVRPLTSNIDLIGNLTYQHMDSRFTTIENFVSSKIPAQDFVNLRIGLEGNTWSVVSYVTNLTNELEFQQINGIGSFAFIDANGALDFATTNAFVNRPRTFGIEFNLKY